MCLTRFYDGLDIVIRVETEHVCCFLNTDFVLADLASMCSGTAIRGPRRAWVLRRTSQQNPGVLVREEVAPCHGPV